MKNLSLFIVYFLLGLVLSAGYFFWKSKQGSIVQLKLKQEPGFSIEQAPKESKKGEIASMSGEIKWESRIATEQAILTKPVSIQQGERLITGDKGQVTAVFAAIGSVSLSSQSEVEFIQTLPVNFVFNQKSGEVEYNSTDQVPFSVRSLHLLTTVVNGLITETVDKEKSLITIVAKKGSAKVAYNNLQNVTTVVEVEEGEAFVFNDDLRQGFVR